MTTHRRQAIAQVQSALSALGTLLSTALMLSTALLLGCASSPPQGAVRVIEPPMVGVDVWGGSASAKPQAQYPIRRITLHHQGEVVAADVDAAAYLRRLQQWSRASKAWSDIPYHFVIAPDGVIYRARPLLEPGDTNTGYDTWGHALVMVMGNFEVQRPSAEQLNSTVALMAWIASEQGLSAADIATHLDFSPQTLCPGMNLLAHVRSGWLQRAVAARLAGHAGPPLPAAR